MAFAWFITGTDTGVGKTRVSVALMTYLQSRGRSVLGMKPVATGAVDNGHGLRNEDALMLQRHGSREVAYDILNPYVFEPAIAPHIAARQAGVEFDLEHIRRNFVNLTDQADVVLVEGVGGWQVPLREDFTIANLAQAMDIPVILVVGVRLGCLNHSLLSADSIARSGVGFAGWVANIIDPKMPNIPEYLQFLEKNLEVPLLGIVPYLRDPDQMPVLEFRL